MNVHLFFWPKTFLYKIMSSVPVELRRLKQIDQRFNCLISGYVKSIISNDNDIDAYIPELVILICLAFYYQIECFDPDTCGPMIIINETRDTIRHLAEAETENMQDSQSVYGTYIIDSMQKAIHEWKLEINSQWSLGNIYIGIDEYENKWINQCFGDENETVNYSWTTSGRTHKSGEQIHVEPYLESEKGNAGDVIVMTLNLFDMTLSYKKYGGDMNVVINDITKGDGIKYKLCVHLYWDNECVTLIEHSVKYQ